MSRLGHTLLVLFTATVGIAAEPSTAELPSIFAPRPKPPASPSLPPVHLPLSPHLRAVLKARIETLPPPPPLLARAADAAPTDAITMAPFVVEEKRPLPLAAPPPKNQFLEAVRTGHLWGRNGKEFLSQGEPGPGGHGRITLGFSLSF